MDVSVENIRQVEREIVKDDIVIRSNILRAQKPFRRPCNTGIECNFGEIPIPDYEKRLWKNKNIKKLKQLETRRPYKKIDKDRYQPVPLDW